MKSKNEKLTLKLDAGAIRGAKKAAKNRGTSLSKMVQGYFESVSEPVASYGLEVSPRVKELTGIVSLPNSYNRKKAYGNYLDKKYR